MTVKGFCVQADAELRTRVVGYREHRDIEHMIAHGWGYVGGQCWAASSNDLDEAVQTERQLFLPRLSEDCIRGDDLVLTYPALNDVSSLTAHEHDVEVRRHAIVPPASSATLNLKIMAAYAGWRLGQSTFLIGRREIEGAALTILSIRRLVPPGVLDVGYATISTHRGNGYAARSLKLFTQWAFNTDCVQRIELGIKPGNAASASTAHKAGYRLESVRRSRLRNADGAFEDEHSYVALKADGVRVWRCPP